MCIIGYGDERPWDSNQRDFPMSGHNKVRVWFTRESGLLRAEKDGLSEGYPEED